MKPLIILWKPQPLYPTGCMFRLHIRLVDCVVGQTLNATLLCLGPDLVPILSSKELPDILSSLGDYVGKQLDSHSARRRATYGNVCIDNLLLKLCRSSCAALSHVRPMQTCIPKKTTGLAGLRALRCQSVVTLVMPRQGSAVTHGPAGQDCDACQTAVGHSGHGYQSGFCLVSVSLSRRK